MATRMNWDWVGDYPIFIYTTWIDNGKFNVKIVKGIKGNQNSGDTGPGAKAWVEYVSTTRLSTYDVVKDATRLARKMLFKKRPE